MEVRKRLLVVDDESLNREMLINLLSDDYEVAQAENGSVAIEFLHENCREVSAILLDLFMPVMNGYEFLEAISKDEDLNSIPVIITTGYNSRENEKKALELGAWDFVSKPYDVDLIKVRLKNAICRSQLTAFVELKYMADYDKLTGLYNKNKMYRNMSQQLINNMDKKFVFIRLDIDRFQLINTFFGKDEGDKLLKYIADELIKMYSDMKYCVFGRLESDIYGICHIYEESEILKEITKIRKFLLSYNPEFDIVPNMGLYVIEDNSMSAETIYNRSSMAAKYCKGNYIKFYSFYNNEMSKVLIKEMEIVNEMNIALEENQFDIYFQPKYDLETNMPYGAEALVRWFHPVKGMIMPGEFIPVFEKNGFISKLDYYVWEKVCKYIRKWIDEGRKPYPVSVNVSRVNMYNPMIVDVFSNLIQKYDLEPQLLNLELTESAYTDNPVAIKKIITKLQEKGFVIMMDDFGSGYSSLNILKEISVDILKIDMRFLSDTDIPGRGDNILASVIRMAKWLNLPVIVEGVETLAQVSFLKSIGCDYVQGFYFATPMPVEEYIKLIDDNKRIVSANKIADKKINIDMLFDSNPQMQLIFSSVFQTVVIYEFADDKLELLRVNEGFYDLFGSDDMAMKVDDPLIVIDENYREVVLNAFKDAVSTQGVSECEYLRKKKDGSEMWIRIRIQYIQMVANKHILFGTLNDITSQKEIDRAIFKYRASISDEENEKNTMLIVDDYRVNRLMLREMFSSEYRILEADNGLEALSILKEKGSIDVILLDLIMPYMDGEKFLHEREKLENRRDIPVIVITSDDSLKSQVDLLSLGVNDYIIKPFVPEIVMKRVSNAMNSAKHKKEAAIKKDMASALSDIIK